LFGNRQGAALIDDPQRDRVRRNFLSLSAGLGQHLIDRQGALRVLLRGFLLQHDPVAGRDQLRRLLAGATAQHGGREQDSEAGSDMF
jgi:hypothetical protein